MINFVLILVCVSIGMLVSRLKIIPTDSFKAINAWLLYVALPAFALRYVPEIEFTPTTLIPAVSPIIVWFSAFAFVAIYAKFKHISAEDKLVLSVLCGIGNTAFLGFPMISAFFGENNIHYAVVFDQVTFILFNTIIVSKVLKFNDSNNVQVLSPRKIFMKIILFPSFLATILALFTSRFINFELIFPFLDKIVATLSPLALFSVGLQIRFDNIRSEAQNLIAGLTYKLFIAPAIILAFLLIFSQKGNLANITIFEAAMPAHITASLLLSQNNINPKLCNLLVGIGIICSFFSSAFWYWICNIF